MQRRCHKGGSGTGKRGHWPGHATPPLTPRRNKNSGRCSDSAGPPPRACHSCTWTVRRHSGRARGGGYELKAEWARATRAHRKGLVRNGGCQGHTPATSPNTWFFGGGAHQTSARQCQWQRCQNGSQRVLRLLTLGRCAPGISGTPARPVPPCSPSIQRHRRKAAMSPKGTGGAFFAPTRNYRLRDLCTGLVRINSPLF